MNLPNKTQEVNLFDILLNSISTLESKDMKHIKAY